MFATLYNKIFLNPGEHEIDLEHYIYESISLSIPLKRMHSGKGGHSACNKDMIDKLSNMAEKKKETKTNPAWDKLKDFLATNNN